MIGTAHALLNTGKQGWRVKTARTIAEETGLTGNDFGRRAGNVYFPALF